MAIAEAPRENRLMMGDAVAEVEKLTGEPGNLATPAIPVGES
jgi:hypothetical protein